MFCFTVNYFTKSLIAYLICCLHPSQQPCPFEDHGASTNHLNVTTGECALKHNNTCKQRKILCILDGFTLNHIS